MALTGKSRKGGGAHVQTHTSRLARFLSTDWADESEGWCWWRYINICVKANQEGHGNKKKKEKQNTKGDKHPLRCSAVCKLQLNSTNRHTESWIIARDTKGARCASGNSIKSWNNVIPFLHASHTKIYINLFVKLKERVKAVSRYKRENHSCQN